MATYETITFQSKLENITTRQDKNGNPYLLLLTEKGNVFCFPTRVGQEKWKDLQANQDYLFTVEESTIGTWILTDFAAVEPDQIWI